MRLGGCNFDGIDTASENQLLNSRPTLISMIAPLRCGSRSLECLPDPERMVGNIRHGGRADDVAFMLTLLINLSLSLQRKVKTHRSRSDKNTSAGTGFQEETCQWQQYPAGWGIAERVA